MKWSIKSKIIAAFAVVAVLIISQSVIMRDKMDKNRESFEQFKNGGFAATYLASQMELEVGKIQQWLTDISATRTFEEGVDHFTAVENYAKGFQTNVDSLLVIYPQYRDELNALTKSFEEYFETSKWAAEEYVKGGTTWGDKAREEFKNVSNDFQTTLGTFVTTINRESESQMSRAIKNNSVVGDIGLYLGLLVAALTLGVALILSLKVGSAINSCVQFARNLATGDFDTSIKSAGSYETKELAKALKGMHTKLQKMQTELKTATSMGNQAVTEINRTYEKLQKGKLHERTHVGTITGSYKYILEKYNSSLDTLVTPLTETTEVLTRYAEGDLTKTLESMPGEMKIMRDAITTIRNNLHSLYNEGVKLAQAVDNGQLYVRGDKTRFHGVYSEIVTSMNETLESMVRPMKVVLDYMNRISKGEIPGKITEEYRGDFNVIKRSLNKYIEAVHTLVAGVNTLGKAAVGNEAPRPRLRTPEPTTLAPEPTTPATTQNKVEETKKEEPRKGIDIFSDGGDFEYILQSTPEEAVEETSEEVAIEAEQEAVTNPVEETPKVDYSRINAALKKASKTPVTNTLNETVASKKTKKTTKTSQETGAGTVPQGANRMSDAIDRIIRDYVKPRNW